MQYSADEILKILPHRQPFLLVDRILDGVPGKSAVGLKNISLSDPVFEGHFPNLKLYPGVLQLEAMAQVGAVVLLSLPEYAGKTPLFAGVKEAKFKQPVKPGDTLIIKTELEKLKMGIGIAKSEIKVADNVVATATLLFAIN